jgi:hypothetical protein
MMLFKYCMIIEKIKIFLEIIIALLSKVKFSLGNINFKKIILIPLMLGLLTALLVRVDSSIFSNDYHVSKGHIWSLSHVVMNFDAGNSVSDKTVTSPNLSLILDPGLSNQPKINLLNKAAVHHVFERLYWYYIVNKDNNPVPYHDDFHAAIPITQLIQSSVPFASRT